MQPKVVKYKNQGVSSYIGDIIIVLDALIKTSSAKPFSIAGDEDDHIVQLSPKQGELW